MAKLNAPTLAKSMLAASTGVLRDQWPQTKLYAELEFNKLAQTLIMIQTGYALGHISKKEAELLVDIQKNAARAVLLTLEGLGIITVEQSINSALKAVRDTVNAAIGFALL